MHTPNFVILGLLAVLLSGCVTAGKPTSANTTTDAPARLRGHVAEKFRYFTHGEPNVNIVAVDNRTRSLFTTDFQVAPGKHLVTAHVSAFPVANATATIALEFQPGKHYRLTAQKVGGAFDLMFWDESLGTDPSALLMTSRIGGKYANVLAADSATLRGSNAGALGYYPWGQSQVRITAIDGQTINPGLGRTPDIHVAAGKRLVTLKLRGLSGASASPTIEMEFEAGKTYRLTTGEVNRGFELTSWLELPEIDTLALVKKTWVQGHRDDTGALLLILLLSRK